MILSLGTLPSFHDCTRQCTDKCVCRWQAYIVSVPRGTTPPESLYKSSTLLSFRGHSGTVSTRSQYQSIGFLCHHCASVKYCTMCIPTPSHLGHGHQPRRVFRPPRSWPSRAPDRSIAASWQRDCHSWPSSPPQNGTCISVFFNKGIMSRRSESWCETHSKHKHGWPQWINETIRLYISLSPSLSLSRPNPSPFHHCLSPFEIEV